METAAGMLLKVGNFPICLEIISFMRRTLQSRARFAHSMQYFSIAGFIYFVVYFVVLSSDPNINIFQSFWFSFCHFLHVNNRQVTLSVSVNSDSMASWTGWKEKGSK